MFFTHNNVTTYDLQLILLLKILHKCFMEYPKLISKKQHSRRVSNKNWPNSAICTNSDHLYSFIAAAAPPLINFRDIEETSQTRQIEAQFSVYGLNSFKLEQTVNVLGNMKALAKFYYA